jgi:LysM repeat protein
LKVGDRLRVPGTGETAVAPRTAKAVVHTVRRGDTLWRIADRYRITVDALCALNNIAKDITLLPGTRLTIRDN